MRATEQAHPSLERQHAVRLMMLRLAAAIFATVMLLLVWHPAIVHAQSKPKSSDTTSVKHVVKAGETLWSITTKYYGDGHQWRAIARRNGVTTNGETAITVGMSLVIPPRGTVLTAAATQPVARDSVVPKAAMAPAAPAPERPAPTPSLVPPKKAGALASQTTGKSDAAASRAKTKPEAKAETKAEPKLVVAAAKPANKAEAKASEQLALKVSDPPKSNADADAMSSRGMFRPAMKAERILSRGPSRIGLIDGAALRASRNSSEAVTVFTHIVPDEAEAVRAVRAVLKRGDAAPRRGEFLAAPFPIAAVRLTQGGKILRRIDAAGATSSDDVQLQFEDDVEITAPVGRSLAVGDQLLAVRPSTALPNGALVAVPSGVLQITRADAGKPARARVRSLSGAMTASNVLLIVEGAPTAVPAAAVPVAGKDIESTVTWLEDGALLPSLQSYLVLAAGETQGVKVGDQFALVDKSAKGPDERIAVARVVRTTPLGSSAIVIRQSRSEINVGAAVRRIAKAP